MDVGREESARCAKIFLVSTLEMALCSFDHLRVGAALRIDEVNAVIDGKVMVLLGKTVDSLNSDK